MSRATVAYVFIIYFVGALAFSAFIEMQKPTPSLSVETIVIIGGAAIGIYAISAVVPLILWACFRFRPEDAASPMVLWASIGVAICYLNFIGTQAERQDFQRMTTQDGRADFIRGALDSCAKDRRKDPQALMNSETYCRCFAQDVAQTATPEELLYFSKNGEPQPNFVAKIKQARDKCVLAAQQSK